MIIVDSHVHIYDCFDPEHFFDSALGNFRQVADGSKSGDGSVAYMLLLAESSGNFWFKKALSRTKAGEKPDSSLEKWSLTLTEDNLTLTACNESLNKTIHLVAGRQIVTAEKIEVLALFGDISVSDGLSLQRTIQAISQSDGLPVIPWGVGKWFGKRGKVIHDFLTHYQGKDLFLGDNGGRPCFWPTPSLFQLARRKNRGILPGTDPLPLPGEENRIGSFGFMLQNRNLDLICPARSLREFLRTGQGNICPYGQLQNNGNFFMNQLQLRFNS